MNIIARIYLTLATLSLCLTSCTSSEHEEFQTVPKVALERYMGNWFVLAHSPNWIENDSYNSIENYKLREDGDVDVTFTYLEGGFDGEEKVVTQHGFVINRTTNAEWRVQPMWPFKLPFLIIGLEEESYRYTVIAGPSREWLWVLARQTTLTDEDWTAIEKTIRDQGFDYEGLRRVPHKWPSTTP